MPNKQLIIGDDNICPLTKKVCDDECCAPGDVCNLASGLGIEDGESSAEESSKYSQKNILSEEKQTNLAESKLIKPALFLDLDGTVRRSKTGKSFLNNFKDIELMPGIEKLIWMYRSMNYIIIGISNQGGVAHGFRLPMEVELELDTTLNLFNKNPFHIVKMCYHMADGKIEPYCHKSLLRKPNIGMLAIAEMEAFNAGIVIDYDKSLFVGDRPEDEECAKNAGVKFEHIDSFLVSPKEFTV